MTGVSRLIFLSLFGASAAHPIGDVITLLERLQVQSKEEGATEQAQFQKFSYWCKSSQKELTKAIAKENAAISGYTDSIAGLKADIDSAHKQITKLETELEEMNNAATKAKKIRDDEISLYNSEQSNFENTVGAISESIDLMKGSQSLLQKGGGSLRRSVELAGARLTHEQSLHIQGLLLQTGRKAAPRSAPEKKAYDNKSGGIIETFKGMNSEFEGEKLDSTQQETNKQNAYTLAKQARDSAITAAQDAKTQKETTKSDQEAELADATTSKSQEESARVSDSTTLDNVNKDCTTKTGEWKQRSETRASEIEAIGMAMKILTKVSGVRNPDSHEIPAKSALFAMVTSVSQDTANFEGGVVSLLQILDPKTKAVTLLKQAAKAGHSKKLQKLAQEISTYEGPFDGIKGMIQKMIFQLMAEQKDEDDHKNWCDLETEKNSESKEAKRIKKEELQGDKNALKSKIALLANKITANTEHVAALNADVKTETELRNTNHEEILATIKDSRDAQKAVGQATEVLKEFYKSSGQVPKEPWEFVQMNENDVTLPAKPETWDSSYTGAADPTNPQDGILAILDGCMQKFSTMEAEAKAQDETDQQNFDKDMAATKVDIETTNADTQMKTSKKDSDTGKMEAASSALKSESSEYDAVDQYLKDLEPACGEGDSSYGERKQARSDEIDALRKAQGILEEAFRAKSFMQKK